VGGVGQSPTQPTHRQQQSQQLLHKCSVTTLLAQPFFIRVAQQSKAKQTKANQSKAKQTKAKQSKAKQE
jgi:hypothetical protein